MKAREAEAQPARVDCPLSAFVNLVSGKWAIPILYRLIITGGPIRFRELQRAAHPITQKELTKHLRHLESRGLVHRTIYAEVPPRVEYEATAVARELVTSLEALAEWMRTYGWKLMERDQSDGDEQGLLGSRPVERGSPPHDQRG